MDIYILVDIFGPTNPKVVCNKTMIFYLFVQKIMSIFSFKCMCQVHLQILNKHCLTHHDIPITVFS